VVECLPSLDDRVDNKKMFEGDSCKYTCKYLLVLQILIFLRTDSGIGVALG